MNTGDGSGMKKEGVSNNLISRAGSNGGRNAQGRGKDFFALSRIY